MFLCIPFVWLWLQTLSPPPYTCILSVNHLQRWISQSTIFLSIFFSNFPYRCNIAILNSRGKNLMSWQPQVSICDHWGYTYTLTQHSHTHVSEGGCVLPGNKRQQGKSNRGNWSLLSTMLLSIVEMGNLALCVNTNVICVNFSLSQYERVKWETMEASESVWGVLVREKPSRGVLLWVSSEMNRGDLKLFTGTCSHLRQFLLTGQYRMKDRPEQDRIGVISHFFCSSSNT